MIIEAIIAIAITLAIIVVMQDRIPCGTCICGGNIYRTPSKNLKGGGIRMGGYRCDSCDNHQWTNKEDWYRDRERG